MTSHAHAGTARFGPFVLDLRSGELTGHGTRQHLRDKPFEALVLLLEHPGEVVTRDELRERLWPSDVFVDFENNLNAAVNRLREALGDSAHAPRYVETLPRRGYRLLVPVTLRFRGRSTPASPARRAPSRQPRRRRRARLLRGRNDRGADDPARGGRPGRAGRPRPDDRLPVRRRGEGHRRDRPRPGRGLRRRGQRATRGRAGPRQRAARPARGRDARLGPQLRRGAARRLALQGDLARAIAHEIEVAVVAGPGPAPRRPGRPTTRTSAGSTTRAATTGPGRGRPPSAATGRPSTATPSSPGPGRRSRRRA